MSRLKYLLVCCLAGCALCKGAEFDPKAFLTVIPGDLPLVLSAPHGGEEVVPGATLRQNPKASHFVVVTDLRTDQLALSVADALQASTGHRPFVVIARFSRKYADANRAPEDASESEAGKAVYGAYHEALRAAVDSVRTRWGAGLLVDLHGQGREPTAIFRGTGDGRTVGHLLQAYGPEALWGEMSLFGQMRALGYSTHPAGPQEKEFGHFDGGYIVQTYGTGPIDAVQMEFGTSLRSREALPKTAKDTALALSVYLKRYVLPAPK